VGSWQDNLSGEKMVQQGENGTSKCQKCGYEFLHPIDDPCPKCGSKLKNHAITLTAEIHVSPSGFTQQEKSTEEKTVYNTINAIIIIITIISTAIGFFCDRWIGLFIGILVSAVSYYLGKKYAERLIRTKIIKRHDF
jgi:hypothetical protein